MLTIGRGSGLRGESTPPTADLLSLCLAHAGIVESSAGDVDLGSLDWEKALAALQRHALLPMAAAVLLRPPGERELPVEVVSTLEIRYRASVARHKVSLVILGRFDRLMREGSIDYAVLKGPHLQEAYYRELFPRPCDDIDILVRKGNLNRTLAILGGFGYRPVGGRFGRLAARWGHFHLVVEHVGHSFPPVELHWELVDRANLYRIRSAEVLENTVPVISGSVPFRALSPEENFMYLCLHALKHGILNGLGLRQNRPPRWFCLPSAGNRLIWYIDLMLLLDAEWERLSWDHIVRRASERNIVEDITLSLEVLRRLFPFSRAAEALAALGGGERLEGARTGPLEKFLESRRGRRIFAWSMEMHGRLFIRPARLFLLGRLLFPAPRQMRRYYSRAHPILLPILYLLHPWHMLLKQISPG